MSSTNVVNFSLRQNKAIERSIVFSGLQIAIRELGIADPIYIGFGSVWFSDFILAHRELSIDTMISIEDDPIVCQRAEFNRPFRTVEIRAGRSFDVMPVLLADPSLRLRPWVVWLDYDKQLDEDRISELYSLVDDLPPNSFLITTFSARGGGAYGAPKDFVGRIVELFGAAAPDGATSEDAKSDDTRSFLLASAVQDSLVSRATRYARPGGFLPAFNVRYADGVPMVTVGGLLPSAEMLPDAARLLSGADWRGQVAKPIAMPPLTAKEVLELQAALPRVSALTRADVQAIGFDLEEDHIASFQDHYLRFPTFSQVSR